MLIGRRDREPPAGTADIIARTGPPSTSRRRRARLAAALMTAALLLAGLSVPSAAAAAEPAAPPPRALPSQPPPPEFVPPPECQAQHAALLAVKQQIDAHNARPHLFRLPAQAAQAAAYDAEANQLNAAQQSAVANLELCLQNAARARVMAALAGSGSGGPPVRTTAPADTRQRIEDAVRSMPRWTPPPPPPAGKPWRIDANSPVRGLYEILRNRNPDRIGDVPLRGTPRPRPGDPDPAYPGSTIGRRDNGDPDVNADHIIPLAELVQMPGFTLLNADNMYTVARAPVNLQWLSRQANLAKGSRSAADILGADPQWKRSQAAMEQEVRARLRDLITFLVYSQGEG
jgi:hypothetical protein